MSLAALQGPVSIHLGTVQAVVLMLFNDADQLSYKDILEQSGIADEVELKRTLQSLALGKSRVLLKDPKVCFTARHLSLFVLCSLSTLMSARNKVGPRYACSSLMQMCHTHQHHFLACTLTT